MIIHEIFYQGIHEYFDQVMRYIREENDIEKRLRLFIKNVLLFSKKDRDFLQAYTDFFKMGSRNTAKDKKMMIFHDLYINNLVDLLNEGMQTGVFREFDALKLAHAFYHWSAGVLFTGFMMDIDVESDDQLDLIIQSLKIQQPTCH